MLTVDDIKYASFRKANLGGYRPEDVDAFIDDVQVSFEKLLEEKAELEKKIQILADKVQQYRNDEDSIKGTLINAQKLSDASLKEAKMKSENILKEAQVKADKIAEGVKNEVANTKQTLEKLKKEASKFRADLLSIYKEHLKLIDALPSEENIKVQENNNLEGSMEKVKHEVEKVMQRMPNINRDNKNDVIEPRYEDLKTDSENVIKRKFEDLKFGENYDINEDN